MHAHENTGMYIMHVGREICSKSMTFASCSTHFYLTRVTLESETNIVCLHKVELNETPKLIMTKLYLVVLNIETYVRVWHQNNSKVRFE